jgi:hypothetical protein
LFGLEEVKGNGWTQNIRLWRRFSKVVKLPPSKRNQIVHILDAFLGSEQVKKRGKNTTLLSSLVAFFYGISQTAPPRLQRHL